jgi:membrane protease YdiL (CAAX protease family)
MAASNPNPFDYPTFRHFLVVLGAIWLGLVLLVGAGVAIMGDRTWLTDPIMTLVLYLLLFGGMSLWVWQQYRQRGINLRSLFGPWPQPVPWRALGGVWLMLFGFSLGAFQVSFTLLSFLMPQMVEKALDSSIFLASEETVWPWLYNILTLGVLVVAAPFLEEFLFRGFLLHRWSTRWSVPVGVIGSSLLFGFLHSNFVGLTLFGLVMALPYLRTGSLWLVILLHSLNNALAAGLGAIAHLTTGPDAPAQTLETFRANAWVGGLMLLISVPFILRFWRQNWPVTHAPLPYWRHVLQLSNEPVSNPCHDDH